MNYAWSKARYADFYASTLRNLVKDRDSQHADQTFFHILHTHEFFDSDLLIATYEYLAKRYTYLNIKTRIRFIPFLQSFLIVVLNFEITAIFFPRTIRGYIFKYKLEFNFICIWIWIYFQMLEVYSGDMLLGSVTENCHIFRPSFSIRDASGKIVLRIKGPCFRCCGNVTYKVEY